jgi:prepilin peptidase CpaA
MATILTVLAVAVMLAAALHDLAARTIPNALPAALALVGAGTALMTGTVLTSLSMGATIFAIAALCWRQGWLGGGDVKLLGAAALALSPAAVPTFIAAVAIGGGALAALYLVLRRVVPVAGSARPRHLLARFARAEQWRLQRRGSLPYACAIAAGFLFVTL